MGKISWGSVLNAVQLSFTSLNVSTEAWGFNGPEADGNALAVAPYSGSFDTPNITGFSSYFAVPPASIVTQLYQPIDGDSGENIFSVVGAGINLSNSRILMASFKESTATSSEFVSIEAQFKNSSAIAQSLVLDTIPFPDGYTFSTDGTSLVITVVPASLDLTKAVYISYSASGTSDKMKTITLFNYVPSTAGKITAEAVFFSDSAIVIPSAPSAPTGLTLSTAAPALPGEIILNWTAPPNGGSPITNYSYAQSPYTSPPVSMYTTTTSYTVFSLTPGETVAFKVFATNALGDSVYSAEATGTVKEGSTVSYDLVPNQTELDFSSLSTATNAWTYAVVPAVGNGCTVTTSGTVAVGTKTLSSYGSYFKKDATATSVSSILQPTGGDQEIRFKNNLGSTRYVKLYLSYFGGGVDSANFNVAFGEGVSILTYRQLNPVDNTLTGWNFSLDITSTVLTVTVNPTDAGFVNCVSLTFAGLDPTQTVNTVVVSAYGTTASTTNLTVEAVLFSANLSLIPTTPSAPVSLVAAPSPATTGAVLLSWTPPYNGGSPLRDYSYALSPYSSFTSMGTTGSSYTVTGLTPGVSYSFKIRTVNDVGISAMSAAASTYARPTLPTAPTGLTATTGASGAVVLSWTAPVGAYAITKYQYSVQTAPGVLNDAGTGTTFTVTGLTPGSTYTFQVVATNVAGNSPASNAATATAGNGGGGENPYIPQPPSSVTARPISPTKVQISWTAPPVIDGYPIINYTAAVTVIEATALAARQTTYYDMGTSTTFVFTALMPGTTYEIRIVATNSAGTSAYSDPVYVTTPPAPKIVPCNERKRLLNYVALRKYC